MQLQKIKKLISQLTSVPSPTIFHQNGLALIKSNIQSNTTDANSTQLSPSNTSSSIHQRNFATKRQQLNYINQQIHSAVEFVHPLYINRLLIGDRKSSLSFLIDSGADVSVIPPTKIERGNYSNKTNDLISLYAANGSAIKTYGQKRLELNLGLRRSFNWTFIIADVKQPIIGADFIKHYKLLIDLANNKLIDETTLITTIGSVIRTKVIAIKAYDSNKEFDRILEGFPEIVNPNLKVPSKKPKTYHFIETKGQPTFTRPRRLAPDRLLAAQAEFRIKSQQGLCTPSKSCWASALHMQPKPDGDFRFCGDYRALNRVTIPDRYPVPYITDFTANLHGMKIFSKIDLKKAFDQIEVHPDDVPKTAITTPFGLFEFKFMTHGLRNASQTFQRFMNEVTQDLNFVFVNIDDILVFSQTAEEHKQQLRTLFNRLREYGLQINPAKCVLGQSQVQFLGYMVTEKGIHPLPDRVAAIKNFKLPEMVFQLKSFLATINYYRRFIPKAVENQSLLQQLIPGNKKNDTSKITWTEELILAFENCKNDLADNTLLVHPVHDAELSLEIDASEFSTGAALHQVVNGQKQPLGFFSQKLTPAESKYSTYDRELLAMYKSVKHFRYMIEGRVFYILTDHQPLTTAFFQKPEKSSPRQLRHLDLIGQFTTDIRHIPGKDNVVADFLSRIQSVSADGNIDFEVLAEAQASDQQLQSYIRDKEGNSLKIKLLNVPNSTVKIQCDISQEMLRPIVPTSFRQIIMRKLHGLSHPGTRATVKMITQRYVWPGIRKDCAKFVRNCIPCQRSKIHRHNKTPLASYIRPNERFEHINIDLIGPLPPSNGHRFALTCIDRFSRWPEAIPLFDITAITVANALVQHWIARFGVPLRITTDQGRQFESELFEQLNRLLGTNHLRTNSYHPQANGIIENWHRTLKASIMCHNTPKWFDKLPIILLGMRSVLKEDIQATPAEMVYGTTLRLPGEFFTTSEPSRNENEFVKEFRKAMSEIAPTNTSNHSKEKIFIQKNLSSCTHVFIRNDTVRKSLQPPYDGPYEVLKRNDKYFTIQIKNRKANISVDRLKAAFTAQPITEPTEIPLSTPEVVPHKPKKCVIINPVPVKQSVPEPQPHTMTRSGRKIFAPRRYAS